MSYNPKASPALTFHDARSAFLQNKDTPRDFLERCLDVIARREPTVRGWVTLNEKIARAAADEATQRYKSGRPLSMIDGMPVGIKDLIETKDMPTQMGSPAFAGSFPKRDSALVRALRDAGAVVLGKTVTTELGFLDPGPTTNPFDPRRTPGGSSSGSGAVVGAGMVPVAIGSQLVGSVLRPASFSGNWALKPTYGAINRGERLGFSQAHIGIHAGCAEDMWHTAMEIVLRAGGDPGHPGLYGEITPPPPMRPKRLVVLETEGWARVEEGARRAFDAMLSSLERESVKIIRRGDSAAVEALERSIAAGTELSLRIIAWEQRWSLANLVEQHPGTLGASLVRQVETGAALTLQDFREDLKQRNAARAALAALAGECDALVSLSAPGPAPIAEEIRSTKYPTGDVSFACVSSLLGAPSVNVPLLALDGLPLGVQVLGQQHQDAQATAIGRWMAETLMN
ncbi:MAG: amidase [Burkholderiales bacterium]|nr:amidase [Burkholderiales bacterium]